MDDKPRTSPPRTPTRLAAHPTVNERGTANPDLETYTTEKLQRLNLAEEQEDSALEIRQPRPHMPLRPSQLPQQPRTRSPYSRPHLRSQSSLGSLTGAPPMLRAHSSPAFSPPPLSLPPINRSSSPLRSPKRVRSPFRLDDTYNSSSAVSDIESIDEDHELDITPRPSEYRTPTLGLGSENNQSLHLYHGNTFPRRRRPASPLYQVSSILFSTPESAASSTSHSPLLSATKFNETFPPDLSYSRSFSSISSSMPSTPTSTRSRSPSISSLETIPDSPGAEEAAIEADHIDRLKRSADAGDSFRRGSMDGGRGSGGFGSRDKRKRWSVCGAEKRSDLNLETIWED